jgi:hypothetical protein
LQPKEDRIRSCRSRSYPTDRIRPAFVHCLGSSPGALAPKDQLLWKEKDISMMPEEAPEHILEAKQGTSIDSQSIISRAQRCRLTPVVWVHHTALVVGFEFNEIAFASPTVWVAVAWVVWNAVSRHLVLVP